MTPDLPVADYVARHFQLTYQPGTSHIATGMDAQISPSGDQVVFTGSVVDDLSADARSRLCLASGDKLTFLADGPGNDRHARWSPDGQLIAFLSDRDHSGRVGPYLLDVRSGVLTKLPEPEGVVEYLSWSPDGRAILAGVADFFADLGDVAGPGCAADPPAWAPSVRSNAPDGRGRAIWIYELGGDTFRRVTAPDMTVWEASWCGPDAILAVCSRAPSEGAWFEADLRLVAAADGASRVLYQGKFQVGVPSGSPSGRHAAVISGLCSDRGVVPGDVVVIDVATGGRMHVDAGGVDVTDLSWIDDDRLGLIGVRRLETVACVWHASCPEQPATPIWAAAESCGRHVARASFASDGRMAVIADSYAEYPRVVVVGAGGPEMTMSLAPDAVSELRAEGGSAEPVCWQAPDGLSIEGWLCKPPGPGPFPLVLHVHGGPVGVITNSWNMNNDTTRLLVGRGFAVLHPNPRGSYGRGQDFVSRVLGDMGGLDAGDLLSGIDELVARGIADPARLVVAGTSYGGFMANLLPSIDGRFAAAVAMSPVTDWQSFYYTSNLPEFASLFLGSSYDDADAKVYRQRSPQAYVSQNRTPTMEVAGLRDLCTPAEQAQRFAHALAEHGTAVSLVLYPAEGHGVRAIPALADLCTRLLTFLQSTLQTTAGPAVELSRI